MAKRTNNTPNRNGVVTHRAIKVNTGNTRSETAAGRATRRPCLSLPVYIEQHQELHERALRYTNTGGRNKVQVPSSVLEQLKPGNANELFANNAGSRIGFVKAAASVLHPIMLAETRPIFWVTLISNEHAMAGEEACSFALQRLQSWARAVLPKVNFVGMVDVGCYPIQKTTRSRIIASFHAHMLCWGPSEVEMAALGKIINAKYAAYVPRRTAYYARRVSPEMANQLTYYMMKHPLKSARFLPHLEWIEPATGEIHERGQDRHYKERISTGRSFRVAIIMEPHRLNDLLFAAGEGVTIRKEIIARAITLLDREHAMLPHYLRR